MTRRRSKDQDDAHAVQQLAFEGFEDAPVIPVKDKAPGKPRWVPYRPKTAVRCDDCVTVLMMMHGHGPATRPARWRRGIAPDDLLLCSPHAQERRRQDALEPLTEWQRKP